MRRDTRRSTVYAALGFCQLPDLPVFPEVTTLKRWLSTWNGIGHVVVGMERQGFVVSLRRLVDDGWTPVFTATRRSLTDERRAVMLLLQDVPNNQDDGRLSLVLGPVRCLFPFAPRIALRMLLRRSTVPVFGHRSF